MTIDEKGAAFCDLVMFKFEGTKVLCSLIAISSIICLSWWTTWTLDSSCQVINILLVQIKINVVLPAIGTVLMRKQKQIKMVRGLNLSN